MKAYTPDEAIQMKGATALIESMLRTFVGSAPKYTVTQIIEQCAEKYPLWKANSHKDRNERKAIQHMRLQVHDMRRALVAKGIKAEFVRVQVGGRPIVNKATHIPVGDILAWFKSRHNIAALTWAMRHEICEAMNVKIKV